MEEQERIETEDEDVEAHRRKAAMAFEEASEEPESDDVEAHALRHRPQSM